MFGIAYYLTIHTEYDDRSSAFQLHSMWILCIMSQLKLCKVPLRRTCLSDSTLFFFELVDRRSGSGWKPVNEFSLASQLKCHARVTVRMATVLYDGIVAVQP